MDALELSCSRTYPVSVEHAFDVVLPLPLPYLFARRYAVIPAIRAVRDQPETWAAAGQSRTIVLADRSTMRETLVEVDRPTAFGYRIDRLRGPLRPLAASVDGRWSFEPARLGDGPGTGAGVRVTWAWTVHPANPIGALLLPTFGRMWQGYARQALEALEPALLG